MAEHEAFLDGGRSLRPRKVLNYAKDFELSEGEEEPQPLLEDSLVYHLDHQIEPSSQTASSHAANEGPLEDFALPFTAELGSAADEEGSIYAPSASSKSATPLDARFSCDYATHSLPISAPVRRKEIPQKKTVLSDQDLEDDYVDGQLPPQSGPARTKARGRRSKKNDPNRIKRPPNAFILFRSHACSNNLIPQALRINDHRQISRIIATMWKSLPPEQRLEWEEKAKIAKEEHLKVYPDYRYKPTSKGATGRKPKSKAKKKSNDDATAEEQLKEKRRCDAVARVLLQGQQMGASSGSTESDLTIRIGQEMRKAAAEHDAIRDYEEHQRRMGIEIAVPVDFRATGKGRRSTSRKGRSMSPFPDSPDHQLKEPELQSPVDQVAEPQFSVTSDMPPQSYQPHWSEPAYQQPYSQSYPGVPYGQSYSPSYNSALPSRDHPNFSQQRAYSSDASYLQQFDIRRPSQVFRDPVSELGLHADSRQVPRSILPYGYYHDRAGTQSRDNSPTSLAPIYTQSAGSVSPSSYEGPTRHSTSPAPYSENYATESAPQRFPSPQSFFHSTAPPQTPIDWFDGASEEPSPTTVLAPQAVH